MSVEKNERERNRLEGTVMGSHRILQNLWVDQTAPPISVDMLHQGDLCLELGSPTSQGCHSLRCKATL